MPEQIFWDKEIAVEDTGGVPFKVYRNRPRRIEALLPFAACWPDRAYERHRVVRWASVPTWRRGSSSTPTCRSAIDKVALRREILAQRNAAVFG